MAIKVQSLRELIKTTFNRSEWKSKKSSLQKWNYLYSIGHNAYKIPGYKFYDDDQTIYWYAYVVHAIIVVYLVLGANTMFYYVSSGEFAKALPCTCLFIGPMISVSFKQGCSYIFNKIA